MALAHSPQSFPRTTQRPMFLNRQDHVLAATGVESAPTAKERTEHQLIGLDKKNQQE